MNVSKINVGMPVQAPKFNAVKSYQSVPMMGLQQDVFQKTTLDVNSAMETLKGIKNEKGDAPKFDKANLDVINKEIKKTPAKYEAIKAMAEIPYVEGETIAKIAKKDAGVVKEMVDYAKAPAIKESREAKEKGFNDLMSGLGVTLDDSTLEAMNEVIPGLKETFGNMLNEELTPAKSRFESGELAYIADNCTAEELKNAKPLMGTKIQLGGLIDLAKDKSLTGKYEKLAEKIKEVQDSVGVENVHVIACEADKENKGSYVISVIDNSLNKTKKATFQA